MKHPPFAGPQVRRGPDADRSAAKFALLWSRAEAALDQFLAEARLHPTSPEARQAVVGVRNRLAQMAAPRPGVPGRTALSRRRPSLV